MENEKVEVAAQPTAAEVLQEPSAQSSDEMTMSTPVTKLEDLHAQVDSSESPANNIDKKEPPTQNQTVDEQDVPADTSEETKIPAEIPATESRISPEEIADLREMFNSAMNSKFYMSNPKRIKVLKEALNIPVSDDKSFQQFHSHSAKDLEGEAYRAARKNGEAPKEVTQREIMMEAHRRYEAKHGQKAIVNEEYEV